MKKIRLITLMMLLFGTAVFAQRNFFQTVSPAQLSQGREAIRQIMRKGVYKLDERAIRNYLLAAPMEFKNNGAPLALEIPLPDGTTETFNIVESPTLSPAIAARHPEIKTYTGNGQKDKKAIIRLSLTSSGFSAIILNLSGGDVYFEPYSASQPGYYINYFTKDVKAPQGGIHRPAEPLSAIEKAREQSLISSLKNPSQSQSALSTGSVLTTYRLAMAADGEFVAQNGVTATNAFNAILAYVNRLNALYRNELSVTFTLVNDENLVFANAATDPYNNDKQSDMLDQNQMVCDDVLGNSGYDIGHVWGYVGGSGGGIASLQSLCDPTRKGRGVSGEGDLSSYAQVFMDQLLFHEMGHQFGMTHTYNSSIPVCETREASTSVEPGSGATIMSYGFTCGSDDYFETPEPQTGPILQFHTVSYAQAVNYMATISCGVKTNTGNTAPVVTVPGNFTIPKSTPFALTGSATDANPAALTYLWEGTNVGTITPTATTLANTAQPPFFRSYAPSNSPTRYYPLLDSILSGSNYSKGDKLPSVGIVTTHEFTVRDNNPAGGGVSSGSVTVTVNGNIGPFLITSNLAATYTGGSTQTVTWSVNGTNAATLNVKISLSTDGGYTFPTVLLASTNNDGNEVVTLPNISTTTARIKVEAVGNIFFDISNSNFSITAAAVTYTIAASTPGNGTITPSGNVSVASGASQTFNFTPAACYKVANFMVDNVTMAAAPSYTFPNVTSAHTIVVNFTPLTYTITATAPVNGTITPVGITTLNCGGSQTYNITPAAGYVIQNVTVDNVSEGAIASRPFTNVTANHTISATFTPTPSNTVVFRINAGGPQVTNSIGVFAADAFYTPANSSTSSTLTGIAGTTDDAIYQTDRYSGTKELNYSFAVSSGQYSVVLHFAEIYYTAINNRIFDVSLEGNKVLDNFDIFKKVGANTATTETFPVTVTDGTLNIYFSSLAADGGANNPKVSAIEIIRTSSNVAPVANAGVDKAVTLPTSSVKLDGSGSDADGMVGGFTWSQASGPNTAIFDSKTIAAPTVSGLIAGNYIFSLVVTDNMMATSAPDQVLVTVSAAGNVIVYRINAGGPQVTNSIGVFSADAYYSPTPGNTSTTAAGIAGTTDDAIYQTERYGAAKVLNYDFPVANGQYSVVLHFAEISYAAVNNRVFDVSLEGTKVLDNFDIFKKVGANTATTETFPINVTDGTLNLYFSSLAIDGGANNPKVSAIEIIRTSANTAPIANAGPDKTITLPTSSTTLSGSGSDPDGNVTGYAWSQVSGPNTASFDSKLLQVPTVSGLIAGTYWFSLVVTDNMMATSAADLVLVTVNAAGNTPIYRINAGGGQVTTSIGVFAADAFYTPAESSTSTTQAGIAATTDDVLYQTDRYSSSRELRYNLPVASGQYSVVLHFAEIYYTAINNRIFDVSLESTKVLNNFDIFKKVGANTATTETFTITVTDGELNIYFSSLAVDGGANNPKVSAIEVIKLGSAQAPIAEQKPVLNVSAAVAKLSVKVSPNPAYNHFTFHITSGNSKTLNLRIFSADGKLIESKANVAPNSSIQMGSKYVPGLYYGEFLQGDERIIMKLIKMKN